jgi:hypothetical protein
MSANDSASEADKWDMSKERELIDTLLGQRFNFFLVFFALMVNGALDARAYHDTQLVNGILTVGATVSLLLALSIGRLQKKLDAILTEVHAVPTHPATMIKSKMSWWPEQDHHIIGYWVPGVCVLAAVAFLILSLSGKI